MPLTIIINQSLVTGIYPDKLKLAKVIPLFKKNEKDKIQNYRPICLLTVISKIFEKVIFNQISTYLSHFKIIIDNQHGFRKNHSTELAGLELIDKLIYNLDNGNTPFSIFIDLAKAFDTLDHEILLYKLKYYGFDETSHNLIKSYLSNRKQYVSFGNSVSSCANLNMGVPQGSVLGPLLFLIYINDIITSTNKLKFVIYADDTTLLGNLNDFADDKAINLELSKLFIWLNSNKLSINIEKTKFICFSKNKKYCYPKLKINNTEIEQVEHFNFFGFNNRQSIDMV